MRKALGIMAAVFASGVLLCGIGTGVAIAEYTSLEYTGEHELGLEQLTTKVLEQEVSLDRGKTLALYLPHYIPQEVIYDEQIPENTIRFEACYNPERVEPYLEYHEADHTDNEEVWMQGELIFYYDYQNNNDFDLMMRYKDTILNDLKQGKVGSYHTESFKSLKISMNPALKSRIDFR